MLPKPVPIKKVTGRTHTLTESQTAIEKALVVVSNYVLSLFQHLSLNSFVPLHVLAVQNHFLTFLIHPALLDSICDVKEPVALYCSGKAQLLTLVSPEAETCKEKKKGHSVLGI